MTDAKTKKLIVCYDCGDGLYDSEQYVDFYPKHIAFWQHGLAADYDVKTLAILRLPSFAAQLSGRYSFYNLPVKTLVFKKTDK